jgi:predicted ATPase
MEDRSEPVFSQRVFVGRKRELLELRKGLKDALAGAGRLFLISGGPGIGKTRLAEQLSKCAAPQNMLVAWGRCWEGAGAPAYWPWIQIFRQCLGKSGHGSCDRANSKRSSIIDLRPAVFETNESNVAKSPRLASGDPEQERFRFFDSAARLLQQQSATEPILIFIDDLQAADEPSLQMLIFVARALKTERVILVGTYRDNELRSSPVVSRLFANLAREGTHLPLAGFSRTEIEEYLNQSAAFHFDRNLIDALSQVTAGNPLFLDGIVRMLEAGRGAEDDCTISADDFTIPHGVREAIRARLNRLTSEANKLLRIGSVIGKDFGLDVIQRIDFKSLAELLGSIDELTHDGIINAIDANRLNFRFSHDLIRETIYKDLLTADRVKLHQQIAEAIEEIHLSNLRPHLAKLAYHYGIAAALGNSDKAIEYSIKAGDAALVTFAYEETTRYWTKAIEFLESRLGTERQRAQLYSRLGWMTGVIERPTRIRYLEKP